MANIAEGRAGAVYFMVRQMSRLTGNLKFGENDGATLERAKEFEAKGRFEEAARDCYAVLRDVEDPDVRVEALFGLSQHLINLGKLRQAEKVLKKQAPELIEGLRERQVLYVKGKVAEQRGWIADYRMGYFESEKLFNDALAWVDRIPVDQRPIEGMIVQSTATHFLGRAQYGKAIFGIDSESNAGKAIDQFKKAIDLDRLLKLREPSRVVSEGFGHLWLARCYLLMGGIETAKEYIRQGETVFQKTPGGGIEGGVLAHLDMVKGAVEMTEGNLLDARKYFLDALFLRSTDYFYPKGLADAAMCVAETYWKKRDALTALGYDYIAFRNFPLSILGGIRGS